jgi:hypothetical protein
MVLEDMLKKLSKDVKFVKYQFTDLQGNIREVTNSVGAIKGQAEGLQGKSYAIVTKNLTSGIEMFGRKITKTGERSIERFEIREQLEDLMQFAENNSDKKFYVTKLGSSLAGYSVEEIKDLFEKIKDTIPNNVILPREYEVRSTKPAIKKKELFTPEKGIAQKSFRGKTLNFVDKIPTQKETVVAMSNNRKTGIISIDTSAMFQKFRDKAWTKPAKQLDGSFATPLAEDAFKSLDEFFTFALIHEVKHDTILKEDGETTGQYEDRINQAALKDLEENYTKPPVVDNFPDKNLNIKDQKCN